VSHTIEEQQADSRQHRETRSQDARASAPARRQSLDEYRQQDDVVDAEHDLEPRKRHE
jgi:hypothetical protein